MKKAIYKGFGDASNLIIIDADIPKVATNEVLVKVVAAALNPKDILMRKGKFKRFTGSQFPQGVGMDFAGIIEQSTNKDFQVGDQVYGMLNGWKARSCAEYVNVNVNELWKKPTTISFEQAAGIPLAGQTSLQAIRDLGQLKQGQKILINGASGGVGTLGIQIAKIVGGEVTTISSSKNLAFCKSLGADKALSYEKNKVNYLVEKFDVFYDVFENYIFKKVAHLLTPKGIFISTVPNATIIKEQFFNLFRRQKAKLIVVKSKRKDLQWFSENIQNNKLQPVVDEVFDLSDIQAAQSYIETKRAKGKVILRISK